MRDDSSTLDIDWTYDAGGRLIGEGHNASDNTKDFITTYAMGLTGNRIAKTQTGFDAGAWSYTYNDRDQLQTDVRTGASPHSHAYTYDASGSQTLKTGDGPDQTFTWDLRNRMASAVVHGVTSTYSYDNDDVRVGSNVSGTVTKFVNDPQNFTGYNKAIEERNASGQLSRSYVFGHSIIAQADSTNGTLTLIKDGRGATRALANTAGVQERYNFDAFQNPVGFDAATAKTTWLSSDGRNDSETGYTYQLARYSNRKTGRWVSTDPMIFGPGEITDANLSLFVSHNPVFGIDPSGQVGLAEFASQNAVRLTLGTLLLSGVIFLGFKLNGIINLGRAKSASIPVQASEAQSAIDYLRAHAGNHRRVKNLIQAWKSNELSIFAMPTDKYKSTGEGTTTQGTNDIYIGQNIIDAKDTAALALVIFGEYQHSRIGGGAFDTPETQKELEDVRRMFPRKDRTPLVDQIHHGGQPNRP